VHLEKPPVAVPTESLDLGLVIPLAAVAVIALGIAIAVVKVMSAKKRARHLQEWTRGAYAIWTGGEDCGSWTAERAQQSLANWYGATGAPAFWGVVADLRQGTTGNVAWDRVRALDLLRIGFAARFVDDDQCWTEAGKIGVELQSKYRTWEELAQAFEAGMQSWQRQRGVSDPQQTGRVQKNLPELRQQIWPRIAYDAALATDD
jgi:hypothetical protein